MINYSFIIPHKNTPKLLQRCLDSIPQREDIEIIVVDNNSTPEIVDFNHFPGRDREDVRLFQDNESIGGGGARNTGLKHARGKWVLFADADDYYSEGFLYVLDKYVKKEIDIVYFNFNRIKNGVIVDLPVSLKYLNDAFSGDDIDVLKYRYTVPWLKMLRRDFLENNHVKFEDCVVGNDILFSYHAGYCAKSILIEPSKIYNYCVNSNSVSTKRDNSEIFYICKYRHHYQSIKFLQEVHHSQWALNLGRRFLSFLINKGIVQFCVAVDVYLKNYKLCKAAEYDFVHIIVRGVK